MLIILELIQLHVGSVRERKTRMFKPIESKNKGNVAPSIICCILLDVRVASDIQVHGLGSTYLTEHFIVHFCLGGFRNKKM